jgi:hypothetical protein
MGDPSPVRIRVAELGSPTGLEVGPLRERAHDVAMDADEPGPRVQGQEQGRDIAQANDRLRVGADGVRVDEVEIAQRQSAAIQRDNGADGWVTQEPVQLGCRLLGRRDGPPARVSRFEQRRALNDEAQRFDRGEAALEVGSLVLPELVRQGRNRHGVAWSQGLGSQDGRHRGVSDAGLTTT